MRTTARLAPERRHGSFDVICAGESLWKVARGDRLGPPGIRFKASGAVHIALLLARTGLRVGLATVLGDDTFGRASLERIAATGVDVGGVTLTSPGAGLLVVDAEGAQTGTLSRGKQEDGLEIPSEWSSHVLLLSGLSPVTSTAAALCRAARRARREGTLAVLDCSASSRVWLGRDPRTIAMVLREADVVRCSFADLAVLGMDAATLRKTLRQNAVLVMSDAAGATATGPFGEVSCGSRAREGTMPETTGAGDWCTAAICAELSRPGRSGESPSGRWHRVLQRWRAGPGL
jgi:sugar/nucleoside kinase (ribokinase family)